MGNLGSVEGEASIYRWRWHYSAMRFLPWLILVVAAVGIKANRTRRTLLLLIPLVTVKLLYMLLLFGLGLWVGKPSIDSSLVQFDPMFYALAIGLTGLWLIAPVLEHKPAIIRILAGMALMMVTVNVVIFALGTASPQDAKGILVIGTSLGALSVLTPAASARLCGPLYRPVAFMLYLGMWLIIGGVLTTMGILAVLMSMDSGPNMEQLPGAALQGAFLGVIFGLIVYALNLPYMLLGFASPFLRERMQACLNLHPREDVSISAGGTAMPPA